MIYGPEIGYFRGHNILAGLFHSPFSENKAFDQRIGGQSIGTHDAGGSQFPAYEQVFNIRLSVDIGPYAPDRIMSSRSNRYTVAHIDPEFFTLFVDIRETAFYHFRVQVFE